MAEEMKHVLSVLNDTLGKNLTLLSFNSLPPDQSLQILSDMLSETGGTPKVDLRQEPLEETVIRVLEMLRIIKYKLNESQNPSIFRQGLVQGDMKVIYPILSWLVSNMDEIKQRSYLARFLVKIEIPPEFLADPDITYLYEQYEQQIEEFKNIHKEREILKSTSMSISELRSDIIAMESEKESVIKKIDKQRRKVDGISQKDALLQAIKHLRIEKDKKNELTAQEEKQRSQLSSNEQKRRRLASQLRDIQQNSGRTSPHDLLRRLEEECSVNAYLAQQKLPMELKARENDIDMMEMVINNNSLTRAHLDDITFKIQQVSNEITQKLEVQMAGQNSAEDKNAPFRQQASIISRKKEAKAEQLNELRSQHASVEEELAVKQQQYQDIAGDSMLRGEEFKKYVAKLRGRSALYKKQKSQLSALKAETGVLSRTIDILSSRDQSVLQALMDEEAQHGVEGYRNARETLESVSEVKSELDAAKGRTLENMSEIIIQLSARVAAKKAQLEPLLSELRPLREEFREISDEHAQLKRVYDSTASGLENATGKLQQEVDKMQADLETAENELSRLQQENAKAEEDLIKVAEEMKLYVSGSAEAKKQSLREQLQQKIAAEDKIGKTLRDEQIALKETQMKSSLQVEYWKDLQRLMKCKLECFDDDLKNFGVVRRERGAETLILPQ